MDEWIKERRTPPILIFIDILLKYATAFILINCLRNSWYQKYNLLHRSVTVLLALMIVTQKGRRIVLYWLTSLTSQIIMTELNPYLQLCTCNFVQKAKQIKGNSARGNDLV